MKILFVCNLSNTSNPFVETLFNGLRARGVEVEASLTEFWNNFLDYDIIHFQWPEAIFDWKKKLTDDEFIRIKNHLNKIKQSKIKMCITIHNLKPHTSTDMNLNSLFDLLYQNCDVFIHMAEYSQNFFCKQYPSSTHIVIPHHIYSLGDDEKRKHQRHKWISRNKINILAFGEIRNNKERALIFYVKNNLVNVNVIAPGLYRKGLKSIGLLETMKRILKLIEYKTYGIKFCRHYISDMDTQRLFSQADVVLIPRLSILNSGNLPMAYAAGKVVVGPNIGNVGCILEHTGNPTFDTKDISTVIDALKNAITLSRNGKGELNRTYAESNWATNRVCEQIKELYNQLLVC